MVASITVPSFSETSAIFQASWTSNRERERERMTTCQSKAHLARALFACYFRAVMLIRDPCVEMLRLLGQAAPPNKVLLESER